MKVKCILCDKMEDIPNHSLLAKQLIKKRVLTYMCDSCRTRIKEKTKERLATGKFRVYKERKKDEYM
jgi:uncharacterized protein YlaI